MQKLFNKFKNRNEPRTATIQPGGESFEVPKNRTLLQAANDKGIDFPQHCTVGTCGSCRCKLLEGEVRPLRDFSYTLTRAEISDGYILACQSILRGDVVVELESRGELATQPAERFTAKITSTGMLTHDIMEVSVQLDRPLTYTAGQFADLLINNGLEGFARHRSYSFSSAPEVGGSSDLSFHIRRVSGGSYTEWLFEKDRTGEMLELRGPNGSFWLRADDAAILCIAGGSGMAPIKAILEEAAAHDIKRPVTYLFGARAQRDLYCLEEMQALAKQWPGNLQFIPILSEEPEGSSWTGKRGLVTEYINPAAVGFDLKGCHTYLCGPPVMIDAALEVLAHNQVPTDHIHYDKFLDSRQLEIEN
ncbi:MAG: 2Fe-2S iron-sulfur cluster binding domain-containing protein [Porticoccaceae bacterium]